MHYSFKLKDNCTFKNHLADTSQNKRDIKWDTPRILGLLINNEVAHCWGQYVTPGNKHLFYIQDTSEKDFHTYWVRFDQL